MALGHFGSVSVVIGKMAAKGLFVLAAVIYQVSAQCLPTQVVTNQLCSCQANQPLPVATTIIDNSVSNSLANALQLLIVSDLIENTINKDCRVVESPVCGQSVVEYPQLTSPVVLQGPTQSVVEYVSSPVGVEYVSSVVSSPVVEYVSSSVVSSPLVEYVSPPVVQYAPSVVEYVSQPVVEYLPSPCGGSLAEVVFPGSIPAQLTCSLCYQPSGAPVVKVLGVEALAPSCGVPGYYY